MTLLYIVRHAYAGQHGDPHYPDDSLRPLTDKGRKQFSRVAKKLVRRGFAPEVVVTSPYVRCRQTAELLCQRLTGVALVEHEALTPGSRLEELIEWSRTRGAASLAWVGHAPDVEHLAGALLGMRSAGIAFAKGAACAIRFDDAIAAGSGELQWFVTPKLLKC
jgi:phosphohistidine phosphatase